MAFPFSLLHIIMYVYCILVYACIHIPTHTYAYVNWLCFGRGTPGSQALGCSVESERNTGGIEVTIRIKSVNNIALNPSLGLPKAQDWTRPKPQYTIQKTYNPKPLTRLETATERRTTTRQHTSKVLCSKFGYLGWESLFYINLLSPVRLCLTRDLGSLHTWTTLRLG